MTNVYDLLADLVLVTHVAFVIFVLTGLIAIIIGGLAKWQWVLNRWFRVAHLLAIGIVVAQAWAGIICPLTTLEMWLREKGDSAVYEGSFIQHWLQQLLYYNAPEWVFVAAYSLFGLAVLFTLLVFPPRMGSSNR